MRIIIPMAGWGTRLRPHTLTVPKPMLPVAGKPIVQRLVEDLVRSTTEKVEDIVFIIREDFGTEIPKQLLAIAEKLGSKGHITYQDVPLGTAHALLCAKDFLQDNIIVAYADTLFRGDYKIDAKQEAIAYVQKIADPSAFGVATLDENGFINGFVEKPKVFVSDLAIIGIYYFREGEKLRAEMQYLIDNNLSQNGEFYLTHAMENLLQKGCKYALGQVDEWLDCGNKDATVFSNQRVLEFSKEKLVSDDVQLHNSVVIAPCFIGEGVKISNSVVGPYVSIGKGSEVEDSIVRNSIIQQNTRVKKKLMENTMLGNRVIIEGAMDDLSLGDFNTVR